MKKYTSRQKKVSNWSIVPWIQEVEILKYLVT